MAEQQPQGIDLAKLAKQFEIHTRDNLPDMEARIRREEAQGEHDRYKDRVVLWAVVCVLSAVSLACVAIVLYPRTQPEALKWATTLLNTLAAGGVGYMSGKSAK